MNRALERIRYSITRLKHTPNNIFGPVDRAWKDKILDYEIETPRWRLQRSLWLDPWKDKILDYEIETELLCFRLVLPLTWKDKILDYEIETQMNRDVWNIHPALERIRYSITRLKLRRHTARWIYHYGLERIRYSITRLKLRWPLMPQDTCLSWKDKILDYEIETWCSWTPTHPLWLPWKDKILDYEIETVMHGLLLEA